MIHYLVSFVSLLIAIGCCFVYAFVVKDPYLVVAAAMWGGICGWSLGEGWDERH